MSIKAYRQNVGWHNINGYATGQTWVSVDAVKKHLNINYSDDDGMISDLITAAFRYIQNYTGIIFSESNDKEFWFQWFEVPSDGIYWLPMKVHGDGVDVSTIFQEFDINDNADQVQDTPTYINMHGLLGFKFPNQLNITSDSVAKLTAHIRPDNTPTQTIKQATIILAAHLYNNRDIVITGASISAELPFHLKALLDMEKVKLF